MRKKVLLLINPNSGKKNSKGQLLDVLNEFASHNYQMEVYVSQKQMDICHYIEEHGEDFDVVAVFGGDGTLNEATNGLMKLEHKPIISYFPTGTMNDFGTNFGLTNDMLQCAKIACKENVESFDVGKMNSRYFNYVAGFGAKKYNRIDKILLECLGIVTVVGLVLGQGAYFFGQQLLSIYSSDERVIQFGINRLAVISTMYCLCGIMDTLVGSLRGIGYSILPMLVSLTGVCLIRVIWIFTVFKAVHTTFSLYISYPITWVITLVAHGICFMVVRKKIRRVA